MAVGMANPGITLGILQQYISVRPTLGVQGCAVDPEPLPALVETRETYRCTANHEGKNCGEAGSPDDQPLTVDESYLDFTESRNGCPSWSDAGVDGACCRKGGCQCGIDPLYYVSPNLCVPCDEPERCQSENLIATWKMGEWTDCSQPCVGSVGGADIIGTQLRIVTCSDQWYNARPESECTAETRTDKYAGTTDVAQFPTKDVTDWTGDKFWFGGAGDAAKRPITEQQCNLHNCIDYTCYKTATQKLVSIEAYGANAVYEDITTDENTADDTCDSFTAVCHFDPSRSDCAKCLAGGCACSWEPVKHLCVSCDVGGSACVGSIPDEDDFFTWEHGVWSGCDVACTFAGKEGVQHRVVTCKGEDGGSYADHRSPQRA